MAGTLTGSGTVNRSLSLATGSTLAPGSSAGTLTTGSLSISEGAVYEWETDGVASDLVDVAGTLDFGDATLFVTPTVTSGPVPTEIVLFEYDALAGVPDASQIMLTGGWSYSGIDTSSNQITLTGVVFTELIFADGFESNDTDEWSATVPSGKSGTVALDPPRDWFELEVRLARETQKRLSPTPAELVRIDDSGGPFALVVSDLAMPGMSGLDLLKTISNRWPNLPLIMMTAHSSIQSAVSAIKLGAFQYLNKPIEPDELLAQIERALEHQSLQRRHEELRARTGDLYHRLNTIPVVIPPLRDRRQDLEELSTRLLTKVACRIGRPAPGLSKASLAALLSHPFTGNVRELENLLERALVLSEPVDGIIELGDFAPSP